MEPESVSEPGSEPGSDSGSAATPTTPSPALLAHERLQRGLIHRRSQYMGPSPTPDGWRTGPVVLLRPSGPDDAERLWFLIPAEDLTRLPMPANVSGEILERTAIALSVNDVPPPELIAKIEQDTGFAVVVFSLQAAEGGPLARERGALDELKGTLAYSDAELTSVDVEAAYAQAGPNTEIARFFELLRQVTPHFVVTPILIALCVLVWLIQLLTGVDANNPQLTAQLAWGATTSGSSLGSEPWRLVTAGFIHGGILHLGINMWALWYLGRLCEKLFGHLPYLAVYLVAVVGGTIASGVWNPVGISVGASGGIFGILGAVLGFLLVRRDTIPRAVLARFGRWAGILVVAQLLLTGAMSVRMNIDNAGHIGGLVAGFVGGLCLSRPIPPVPGKWERGRLAMIPALLVLLGLTFAVASQSPQVARQRALSPLTPHVLLYLDLYIEHEREQSDLFDPTKAGEVAELDRRVVALAERVRAMDVSGSGELAKLAAALDSALVTLSHVLTIYGEDTGPPGYGVRRQAAEEAFIELMELRAGGS